MKTIYVLTNKHFPAYVKITDKNEKTTAVPDPYDCIYSHNVQDSTTTLNNIYEYLQSYRKESTDFFNIQHSRVVDIVSAIVTLTEADHGPIQRDLPTTTVVEESASVSRPSVAVDIKYSGKSTITNNELFHHDPVEISHEMDEDDDEDLVEIATNGRKPKIHRRKKIPISQIIQEGGQITSIRGHVATVLPNGKFRYDGITFPSLLKMTAYLLPENKDRASLLWLNNGKLLAMLQEEEYKRLGLENPRHFNRINIRQQSVSKSLNLN
jgi:hypothetical protein